MPTRRPSRSFVSAGLALLGLALAGLLSVSFPPAGRLAWHAAKRVVGPILTGGTALVRSAGGHYATSDIYLADLTIPDPSAAVVAALAEVPTGETIIFLSPKGEPTSEIIYQVISYLGWPRAVGRGECGAAGHAPVISIEPPPGARVGGVLFYRAGPVKGRAIGPQLTLVRVAGTEEWNRYCAPPRS